MERDLWFAKVEPLYTSSMKKLFHVLLVALLVSPILVNQAQSLLSFDDNPGDGFAVGDECGFIYGAATPASGYGTLSFDEVSNMDQGCVEQSGYFYSGSGRESLAYYYPADPETDPNSYTLDFDYDANTSVFVDPVTGLWSGKAKLLSSTATIPFAQSGIEFEWNCTPVNPSALCNEDPANYFVRTNLTTGEVGGYAWSPYLKKFISFHGFQQELAPQNIETYVSIYANDSAWDADSVAYENAPLADGAEFWRVQVQFWDSTRVEFIDPYELTSIGMEVVETDDSRVYLNQVENTGDAIVESHSNTYPYDCSSAFDAMASTVCTIQEAGDDGLMNTEDDSWSFNTFIYSSSPTSNMLGLNDDTDAAIEYYSDRDGCRWIYPDQEEGEETLVSPGVADCPDGSGDTSLSKADVFQNRQVDRNQYIIDHLALDLEFRADREVVLGTSDSLVQVDENTWHYFPGTDLGTLSYRPRFLLNEFVMVSDGVEYSSLFNENEDAEMQLRTRATVSDTSAAYQAQWGAGSEQPTYFVNYQMDVNSDPAEFVAGDLRLLIDVDAPGSADADNADETRRMDTLTPPNSAYTNYFRSYVLEYGQSDAACALTMIRCVVAPRNTVDDPTAEQWVCDTAAQRGNGADSCYYTDYLPHIDRHADPESMLVIGAINASIDANAVLEEMSGGDGISVLGNTETIDLRNQMYAQVARYILGQSASSGSFDTSGRASGGLKQLMGGRLVYAEGDVSINGFDGNPKTLVVIGGDVFINSDIVDGRMGIIAFKKDGVGGNAYIRNDVTDLNANIFLDGSLFSSTGTAPVGQVYPSWDSDEERLEALMHQLYLRGSLVSLNTVNGSIATGVLGGVDAIEYYTLGDGTTTETYDIAREYDLNLLRQFRRCHPVVDGVLDTGEWLECEEGEQLSNYAAEHGGEVVYNSFILEYEPADQLPVFQVGAGLFD